jgi:hypothetical protein
VCFGVSAAPESGGDVGSWSDADGITEYMKVMHADMVDTKHRLTNFVIEVDGDTATASTYVHAVLVVTNDPLTWFEPVGRYEDRLVRTPGGWRISQRVYHSTRMLSSHPLPS